MIISDGQLASKTFHCEGAGWDLISALSIKGPLLKPAPLRGITSPSPEGGRAPVNKATLKEREGAPDQKGDKLVTSESAGAALFI